MLVINTLRLGSGNCDVWPEKPAINGYTLTFSGVFPSGCGEKFRYYSLLPANDYAQALFRQVWRQVGGEWSGNARGAELPVTAKLFATWESAPLSGQAHMKTGYIAGVRAIAGYTLDARGRMLAVVLIINHAGARNAQPVQDALLEWVSAGPASR